MTLQDQFSSCSAAAAQPSVQVCVQVLGSLVAGITTIAAGKALADVTPVDLFDDRKAKKTGFDLIYEARDLDLDQATRDGLTQYRGDITATKARYKEATKRINKEVGQYIEKEYWCASQNLH
jgi:photosystem II oxygen-evolving enhancer protein 3